MKTKQFTFLIILVVIGMLLIAACSSSAPDVDEATNVAETEEERASEDGHDESEAEAEEHMDEDDHGDDEHEDEDDDHSHIDPPHEFAEMTNPFLHDADAIAAGQPIFEASCVVCHGSTGEGDGPGAAGLDPQPASLADPEMMSDVTDGYLFWRISEGGMAEPFNSAMPPWKDVLSEEEIWQVVNYVRELSE
jgi:cytochrome c553